LLLAACNKPPVALFSVDHVDGTSPLTVQFDGSTSFDPDGQVVDHSWDFDDGGSALGESVTHTFVSSVDRSFSVELTVTDNQGGVGSTAGSIFVHGTDSGSVLFFDDFEDGRDSAWVSTPGWFVANGKYGCVDGWKFSYVLPGTDWGDYAVDVDLDSQSGTAAIILRSQQDLENRVAVCGNHSAIWWAVIVDGTQTIVSDDITPGFFDGVQHVRVVARGSSYELYVAGLLRSTFSYGGFLMGMPGLAGSSVYSEWGSIPEFDNFRVTALE
jgi:PKD repeat protein